MGLLAAVVKPRRRAALVFTVTALVLVAASCGSTKAAKAPPVLPPAPPSVLGLVSLIGEGNAQGSGTSVEAVDLSAGVPGTSRTLSVGTFPDAIAVDDKLDRAYVTNYISNSITPINLKTGKVGVPIAVGNGPAAIAITPDGKTAYVTNAGQPGSLGDTVTPVDLKTGAVLAPITVGKGPQGIVITPDGATAYVADAGAIVTGQTGSIGNTVTPINLTTRKALPAITVGNGPLAVAATSDGSTVYVTNSYSGSVSPIATATNAPGTPIEMSGSPQALAFQPNAETLWVADATSSVSKGSNLTPIDLTTQAAGKPISVCSNPTSVAITPDGATAWVVCSAEVEPVELSSATVNAKAVLRVSGGAYAIALGSDTRLLKVAPAKKAKKTS